MSVQMLGNQIVDQFPINNWATPTMTYGLTYLPPSYATSNKNYPLIIHLEGLGEIGTGITGLNNLLKTSLPKRIAGGFQPSAVNPVDKQTYEFIVVSPQGSTSAYQWLYLQYILANIISRYRIDKTRIYITGYSSGGYACWTCITDSIDFCKLLAAVVPVSAEPIETTANVNGVSIPRIANIVNAAKTGLAVWNICGAADSFITFAQQSTAEINAANPPIKAALTSIPNDGHDSWNYVYDPAWVDPVMKINFYQWLLQYKLGGSTPVPTPTPTPSPTPGPAKTVSSILVTFSDGSTQEVNSVTVTYTVGQSVATS